MDTRVGKRDVSCGRYREQEVFIAATAAAAASYAAARKREHVMDGLRKMHEGYLADTKSNQGGRYWLLDQERGKLRHVGSDPSCHHAVQTGVGTGAGAAGAASTVGAVVGAEGGLCGGSDARYVVLLSDAGRRVNQAHAGGSVGVTVTAAAGSLPRRSGASGGALLADNGRRVLDPRGVCCGGSGDGNGGRSAPWQNGQRRRSSR